MRPLSPMDAQRRLSLARNPGIYMSAGHRRALETIAGMRTEYMALNRADENGEWHQVTPWSVEWPFRTGHAPDPRFDKVIRRYVTEPEVTE